MHEEGRRQNLQPELVLERDVSGRGAGSTGTATIEAGDPEDATVIDHPVRASGKAHMDVEGKWLGAACEGIGRE